MENAISVLADAVASAYAEAEEWDVYGEMFPEQADVAEEAAAAARARADRLVAMAEELRQMANEAQAFQDRVA